MMMNKKLISLIPLFWLLAACNQGQTPSTAPSVVTQKPQLEKIMNTSSYAGNVTTVESIDILPRIEGYLRERRFEQGQLVHEGDVLFVIEPDQYEATVMQKRADLSAAEATLTERTLNVERMRTLYEKRVVAQANKDQAESNYYNAIASVNAAKAALINAELNLSYTVIKAPLTGRIGVTTFSPGDYLSPNTSTLTTIVQIDPIRVVFSIPEREWLQIETKNHKTPEDLTQFLIPKLKLSNGSIYEYPGKISFVDNHIDPASGALAVYSTFENPKAILLPGQFVTVIIEIGAPREALMVPSAAVLYDKEGHYLLLVNAKNEVEKRYVKTGLTQNTQMEITEGLTANDVFISEGVQKVMPGIQVSPTAKSV